MHPETAASYSHQSLLTTIRQPGDLHFQIAMEWETAEYTRYLHYQTEEAHGKHSQGGGSHTRNSRRIRGSIGRGRSISSARATVTAGLFRNANQGVV
jgi:hypothetical protein